jgi:hypothetical protein
VVYRYYRRLIFSCSTGCVGCAPFQAPTQIRRTPLSALKSAAVGSTLAHAMAFDLGPLGHQSITSASLLLIGGITVLTVLFQITRVLLSIFILPGTPVRPPTHPVLLSMLIAVQDPIFWTKRLVGCCHRCQRWHWQAVRDTVSARRLQCCPRVPNRLQALCFGN